MSLRLTMTALAAMLLMPAWAEAQDCPSSGVQYVMPAPAAQAAPVVSMIPVGGRTREYRWSPGPISRSVAAVGRALATLDQPRVWNVEKTRYVYPKKPKADAVVHQTAMLVPAQAPAVTYAVPAQAPTMTYMIVQQAPAATCAVPQQPAVTYALVPQQPTPQATPQAPQQQMMQYVLQPVVTPSAQYQAQAPPPSAQYQASPRTSEQAPQAPRVDSPSGQPD